MKFLPRHKRQSLDTWLFGDETVNSKDSSLSSVSSIKRISKTSKHLQGQISHTFEDIVNDPKRFPFLLKFLSNTNSQRILLLLEELQQLKLVRVDYRLAEKVFNKYLGQYDLDNEGIMRLNLAPHELETMQKTIASKEIICFDRVEQACLNNLKEQQMPQFLKSIEYLEMLDSIEHNEIYISLQQIVQRPRAAHYFLVYLIQKRQHLEFHFWLQVEYVLKKLVNGTSTFHGNEGEKREKREKEIEEEKGKKEIEENKENKENKGNKGNKENKGNKGNEAFWSLAAELGKEINTHSEVIPHGTKQELESQLESQSDIQSTLSIFSKAQQDIFRVLQSSLYSRFVKSPLFQLLTRDPLVRFDKLENDSETTIHDYVVDLQKVLRLTDLPVGIQMNYTANYVEPTPGLEETLKKKINKKEENIEEEEKTIPLLEYALSFSCSFSEDPSDVSNDVPNGAIEIIRILSMRSSQVTTYDDLTHTVKRFLVPDGRLFIADSPPGPKVFPFLQTSRQGEIYGACLLLYRKIPQNPKYYSATGVCLLSKYPLVNSLRQILQHCTQSMEEHLIPTETTLLQMLDYIPQNYEQNLKKLIDNRNNMKVSTLNPLPWCPHSILDFSLEPVFQCLSPSTALEILALALLERQLVFISRHYTLLGIVTQAFRSLLHPLKWCHVFAPILPKEMISYLHCPTPFIVGVCSSYITREDLHANNNMVLVNLDSKVIEGSSICWSEIGIRSRNQCCLPQVFEHTREQLEEMLMPDLVAYDDLRRCERIRKEFSTENVRVLFADLIQSLLTHVADACLVVGDWNDSLVIFDEKKFISSHPMDQQDFLTELVRVQSFSDMISTYMHYKARYPFNSSN